MVARQFSQQGKVLEGRCQPWQFHLSAHRSISPVRRRHTISANGFIRIPAPGKNSLSIHSTRHCPLMNLGRWLPASCCGAACAPCTLSESGQNGKCQLARFDRPHPCRLPCHTGLPHLRLRVAHPQPLRFVARDLPHMQRSIPQATYRLARQAKTTPFKFRKPIKCCPAIYLRRIRQSNITYIRIVIYMGAGSYCDA